MSESLTTDRGPALRQMLEAVVERRKARQVPAQLTAVSAAELFARPLLPLWRARMEHAAQDGIMESLYASIREEGWRAFAVGGIEAMHALADKACGSSSYLSSILDHRWDGIGLQGRGVWVRSILTTPSRNVRPVAGY